VLFVDVKRIVSSLTLDRYALGTGWVWVDLRTVVEDWMTRPGRNNGLQILVTDSDHHAVDPLSVFESYDCSLAAETVRSNCPPVLLHIPTSASDHSATRGDLVEEELTRDELNGTPVNYPHLKLITVEVPRAGARHRRDGSNGVGNGAARPSTCVMEKITVSLDGKYRI